MTTKLTLGFIGPGLMGHGAAKNLLKAGYPLVTMAHRNQAPVYNLATLLGHGDEVISRVAGIFAAESLSKNAALPD